METLVGPLLWCLYPDGKVRGAVLPRRGCRGYCQDHLGMISCVSQCLDTTLGRVAPVLFCDL